MKRKQLVKSLFKLYPVLAYEAQRELGMDEFKEELQKEKRDEERKKDFRDKQLDEQKKKARDRKIGYYATVFEAVALAHICFNQLDNH